MIQFGMRAHDFCPPGKMVDLFSGLHHAGIRHIQLALEKSVSDYDFTYGHYSAGFAHFISQKLKENDLHVAVLGCYINPVNPDEIQRMSEIKRFIERMRYAKRMNADLVGTETGRYSIDMSVTSLTESKECYRLLLDSFSQIADAAEAMGVMVGVEGVFDHTLSSPEKMKQFLDDIASPCLEVILDAANLVAPWATDPDIQNRTIDKAFSLYGDRISVLHLKDCVFDENGVQQCTRPGKGLVVYDSLLQHVQQEKPQIIGLLEESSPEYFKRDCNFFANLFHE